MKCIGYFRPSAHESNERESFFVWLQSFFIRAYGNLNLTTGAGNELTIGDKSEVNNKENHKDTLGCDMSLHNFPNKNKTLEFFFPKSN